ncbi:MAG: thioesterase [Nitrososphaeria archaeon]|nr:thioesterase [Nitrososphaeria archaeon]
MILTHQKIDETISGKCVDLIHGKRSIVVLKTQDFMKVDDKGLVHGGFTFSLADYAAMVAVNHPNVVLYKAEVKFKLPVKVGDTLVAKARVYRRIKNRYFVEVQVLKDDKVAFIGKFLCIVLESHVLDLKK